MRLEIYNTVPCIERKKNDGEDVRDCGGGVDGNDDGNADNDSGVGDHDCADTDDDGCGSL